MSTKAEGRRRIEAASAAIQTAAHCIRSERETIRAFLKESRDMDNFGHVVDPTLWNNPERRAVDAVLRPIFEEAERFLNAFDVQMEKATAALRHVQEQA
jgi:hypothetical protein